VRESRKGTIEKEKEACKDVEYKIRRVKVQIVA
jgi:hypothetical protein